MKTKLKIYTALKVLAVIALICTLACAVFILVEGATPGEESAKHSNFIYGIFHRAGSMPITITTLSAAKSTKIETNTPAFTRKFVGHFLLFAVLGFGLCGTAVLYAKHKKFYIPYSLFLGVLIAALSEILQLPAFTEGRSASLTDVGIDASGLVVGIFLAVIIVLIAVKANPALKTLLSHLNTRTLFTKYGKLSATSTEEYERILNA